MMNFGKLNLVIALTLIASTTAASAKDLACRDPEKSAIFRDIQASGDRVFFNYYPSELVDEFTLEYLNCRTSASISIEMKNKYFVSGARDIVQTAIDSPVKYTRTQVIDALKKANYKARPGKLDTDVCACWDKVLKKAKNWN